MGFLIRSKSPVTPKSPSPKKPENPNSNQEDTQSKRKIKTPEK